MKKSDFSSEYAIALLALYGLPIEQLEESVKRTINNLDFQFIVEHVKVQHRNVVLSHFLNFKSTNHSSIFDQEQEKYRRVSVINHCLLLQRQLEIQKMLDEKGIRCAFIKGICFDSCLSSDDQSMYKIVGDIDLLTHPSEAAEVYQFLRKYSYQIENNLSNYLGFYQRFGHHYPEFDYKNIGVDIHHRVVWPYMTHLGINYYIPEILERREFVTINNKNLHTVDEDDRCLLLMCFIYKDQVYAHNYNPYNVCSLLLLLMKRVNCESMIERIVKYNIIEPVKYCINLCSYLHFKLFGKEFECDLKKHFDFPVDGSDSIDQFRSHTTYMNEIIGYFDFPLENRYFMTEEELAPYVYKKMLDKYGMSPQALFEERVVKTVEKCNLKHPPTQKLI